VEYGRVEGMIGNRTEEELKADIKHVNECLNPSFLYSTADLVAELKCRCELCPVVDDMDELVYMFVTTKKSRVTEVCKRDGIAVDIKCADGVVTIIAIMGGKNES
jgi:hypothetical protein